MSSGTSGPSSEAAAGAASGGLVRLSGWWAPWLALVAVAVWTARPAPAWLAVASVFAVVSAVVPTPRALTSRTRTLGRGALLLTIPLGFLAHLQLARLAGDFDAWWNVREAHVFEALTESLADLVDRGDRAVETLAAGVGEAVEQEDLESLREDLGLAAVVVYDAEGAPVVWAGSHRGRVPEAVQYGDDPYLYGDLPLFRYLYFTIPLRETGGTAVVAALLDSELPEDLRARPGDFVSDFRRATGEDIRISRTDRVEGEAVSDFIVPGDTPDTLFSVSVVRPSELERRERLAASWARGLAVLLLGTWLLLAVGGRRDARNAWCAASAAAALALLLPSDAFGGAPSGPSAGDFVTPGPFDLTLPRLLALAFVATAAGALFRPRRRPLPPWLLLAALAVAYPVLVGVTLEGASAGFLALSDGGWILLQLVLTLLLTVVTGSVLSLAPVPAERPSWRRGLWRSLGALALGMALGAVGAGLGGARPGLPLVLTALWALPVGVALGGVTAWGGWRRSLLAWTLASALATTATLPFAWSARTEARILVAEQRVQRLRADVDPHLHYLLSRFTTSIPALHRRTEGPVDLLYRGWRESGLAGEDYPVWLTVWSPGGIPVEDLPVGLAGARPPAASDFAAAAGSGGPLGVVRVGRADAHYVATVLLDDGSVVTAVVPPRQEVRAGAPLGPLFPGLGGEEEDRLTMVPLLPSDAPRHADTLVWVRAEEGWRGEVMLSFPDQRWHAHYVVELAGPLVLVARATLLLVLNVLLVALVWLGARRFLLGQRPSGSEVRPLVTSFRARVTAALFGFFLLSNAIFGTLAYRTIAGAAERAAAVLAGRVVEDVAGIYNESSREMELLGRQVGADLLEYRDGELREGSTQGLVELGLFDGLLPWEVHRTLASREEMRTTEEGRLGRWEYVTAYGRLPDGDVLGAPVPLQAGATAVRREEVAHLLGFAVVVGGLLSMILALLVGRTLTRPIQTLQVASERVGSGNLEVRLPTDRSDEFGSVFDAFNRMVRRLRRARRDLLRTTRRTQAIVEDAATGVVALDPGGRVTLANRRASELISRDLTVGRPLREAGDPADELVRWIGLYYRDGLREASGEFHFGDRRVRVRARRIASEGTLGGAVLSLEDVTDELRAERVLAWGEMARQVAHEVKNPLTPIKLSIQHIRRAWDDRRPDFQEILIRNADAALREIDRLAAIASSFSRFGAPGAAGEGPLQPVRLDHVVGEVMALYGSGEQGVRFRADLPPDLPSVAARPSEVKEVLVNLLENARAAVADEGEVSIAAAPSPGGVRLTVRDDGAGIPPELLPRIFEPHFSTRSAGTGLGLAIVQRLVESWGAGVEVESELGQGTGVTVRLRRWNGVPPAGEPDGAGTLPAGEGRQRADEGTD